MNFKELREANLSKAQINKVHDKADDLPKSDFIKRYGKNGDAVRFATATNQVKKELGLEAYTTGPGTSRGRQGDGTYPGWDNAIPITLPTGAELRNRKPKSLLKRIFSDLDKEDEKSVGRVVKGLKKAVKAHQGQVDALTKDIKDEVKLTEKKAEFLRLDFKNKNEVEKLEGWMYKFISQVNAPYDSVVFNKHRLDGFSVEFEGMDDADALMTKLKRAGFRFKVDMRENLDLPATGDTTTSNASQEVETVELDEAAFSQAQIDTLKKAYGSFSSTGVSMNNMNKLRDTMKRYSKDHLSQLAKLDIPMVSKTAKELL